MSQLFNSLPRGLGCWLGCLWLGLQPATAQLAATNAAPASTNTAPVFQLTMRREFIPNVGEVARGRLLAHTNQISFLIAPETLARTDPEQQRVRFVARDDSYSITLQFRASAPTPTSATVAEAWRAQLASRHAGLRELEAFTSHALGTNGPGLDFVWPNASGHRLWSRAILLPLPGGAVEVALLADEGGFETGKHRLNSLLLSLRRAAIGEAANPPLVVPD